MNKAKTTENEQFIMLPKNDFAFKMLFGNEGNQDLLIDLLAAIFGKDVSQLTDIEYINPDLLKASAEDKQGILDIRAKSRRDANQHRNSSQPYKSHGSPFLVLLEQNVCHPTGDR